MKYQNYQNLMLLTSSDTKRTLMHLFLFTNSAQRELVLICTQSRGGFCRGVNIFNLAQIFFYPPGNFITPLEKYHDVYQTIGFNRVWFVFSTHFWDLQTHSNKGFITYLSAFTLFYILHYSHSFYINYKDL